MSGHAGCKRPDMILRNKRNATHGMTNSPEFKSWQSAKDNELFAELARRGYAVE